MKGDPTLGTFGGITHRLFSGSFPIFPKIKDISYLPCSLASIGRNSFLQVCNSFCNRTTYNWYNDFDNDNNDNNENDKIWPSVGCCPFRKSWGLVVEILVVTRTNQYLYDVYM